MKNPLGEAARRLERHYGPFPETGRPGQWLTVVRTILELGPPSTKRRDWSWLDAGPLGTAEETAAQPRARLAEILEEAGEGAGKAGALYGCARWWMRRFEGADVFEVLARRPLEAWQQELRAIGGVNWELADRILLAAGGLAVYPLDRGSLRIAVRHGWIEATADYDEWQAFFVAGLRDALVNLPQAAKLNARVGRDFCGAVPKCDECPLKSLLPEQGPVPLDGDG